MIQMKADQTKSIQILAVRRTEQKKKLSLKKKFAGAMPFVGPESSGKNN